MNIQAYNKSNIALGAGAAVAIGTYVINSFLPVHPMPAEIVSSGQTLLTWLLVLFGPANQT